MKFIIIPGAKYEKERKKGEMVTNHVSVKPVGSGCPPCNDR